jgi:serine/threonine protein kinase
VRLTREISILSNDLLFSDKIKMLPEREPLPWSTRMQIALDSARGLEYIHEHTVRVYIHRDIKSENILLDKNFRAKVEITFWNIF